MTCYLIEEEIEGQPSGRCLGASCRGGWCWTVPNLAIRFARKEDAQAASEVMLHGRAQYTIITEHVFS